MSAISTPIEKLERRLRRLEELLRDRPKYAEQAIDEITIEAIKTKMFAANYSVRIIDNVELRDVIITGNSIKYSIFNELLVGLGFDIAQGREGGIPPHKIFGNPYLAFKMGTIIGAPVNVVVASVNHPGLEASWIIRDTVRENQFAVQERYSHLVKNKIRDIKNSS